MMLEKYASLFSKLRTDKGRHRYPAITKHRAPHKPFLLLSVMDLITRGGSVMFSTRRPGAEADSRGRAFRCAESVPRSLRR